MASSAWGFNTAGLASETSSGLVQAGGYNVLPAGTVLPYAGGTAPAGFVFCDGAEISKTTYPQLYAAIADAYATQTNPTTGAAWAAPAGTNFRVPDYRGSFLRGAGTASGKDATTLGGYQAEKTKANGLALSGTGVTAGTGTFASSGHQHNLATGGSDQLVVQAVTTGGVNKAVQTNTSPAANVQATTSGGGTATVSLGSGDNETRPLNKGVNYIIKY
jgi:hypothetical protein